MVRWKWYFLYSLFHHNYGALLCILSVQLHSFSSHINNHRIFETGRHLWTSTSPTLCSKQSQVELTTQGCIQSGFKYFQWWGIHRPSRPPMAVATLGTRTHYCWTCCLPRPSDLLCKAAFQLVWEDFFLSRERTWLFPLSNFLCFLTAHSSRILRTLWTAAQSLLWQPLLSLLCYLWIFWGCVHSYHPGH